MREMKIFNVEISGVERSMIASGYPMESKDVKIYDDWTNGGAMLIYDNHDKTVKSYNRDGELETIKVMSPTISKLANAKSGSGHDCFLKGINVSFDISYPVYWSPQLQRYHHLDIVSSSSAMHRLTRLELSDFISKTVDPEIVSVISNMIHIYNKALNLINEIKQSDSKIKDVFIRKYYTKSDETVWDLHIITRDDSLVSEDMYENYEKIQDPARWETYSVEEMFHKIVATCPQGLMKTMRVTTNALQLKTIISQRSSHKLDEWKYFVKWAKSLYFWRYFGMYQQDSSNHVEELIDKFETLFHLFIHGYQYYRRDLEKDDYPFHITPYHYGPNDEKRVLTSQDDKVVSTVNTLLKLIDLAKSTYAEDYLRIIWRTGKFILLVRCADDVEAKIREKDQIIKTLENYILQHAHGKMTTEEMCSKTKEILGGCDD